MSRSKAGAQNPLPLVLLVTLAIGVAWFMFVRPLGAKADAARDDRDTARQQLAALELATATTTTEAPTGSSEVPDALETAVPDEPELAELLRALDRAGAATGMAPPVLTPGMVNANPAGGGVIQVDVSTSGAPDDAQAYVAELARLPRLVVVDSITVDDETGDSGDVTTRVQLSARVFTATSPTTPSETTVA